MTSGEARDKVLKLLALAAPGSGASPNEAATAARIANDICAKYRIPPPSPSARSEPATTRALRGQVIPGWRAPSQRTSDQGWSPWPARSTRSSRTDQVGISGISDVQARDMAMLIIATAPYLQGTDLEIIEGALNGLLTEYGKILLDGLYAVVVS